MKNVFVLLVIAKIIVAENIKNSLTILMLSKRFLTTDERRQSKHQLKQQKLNNIFFMIHEVYECFTPLAFK